MRDSKHRARTLELGGVAGQEVERRGGGGGMGRGYRPETGCN